LRRIQSLHRRARGGDRGAVLVEFALIAPVLVLLMLGMFEYGNAWRQVGRVERAAQQGARTASSMANHRFADYEALRAIDTATRDLNGLTVERVIIFNATDDDGEIPNAACLTGSVSGVCNTYTGAQVRTTSPAGFSGGSSSAPTCSGSLDAAWCPLGRSRDQSSIVRVGVHLTLTYESVTELLPTTVTIERTAVYQIDPCQQGETTC
jgi:Flp pilus assembly protein TadG